MKSQKQEDLACTLSLQSPAALGIFRRSNMRVVPTLASLHDGNLNYRRPTTWIWGQEPPIRRPGSKMCGLLFVHKMPRKCHSWTDLKDGHITSDLKDGNFAMSVQNHTQSKGSGPGGHSGKSANCSHLFSVIEHIAAAAQRPRHPSDKEIRLNQEPTKSAGERL